MDRFVDIVLVSEHVPVSVGVVNVVEIQELVFTIGVQHADVTTGVWRVVLSFEVARIEADASGDKEG